MRMFLTMHSLSVKKLLSVAEFSCVDLICCVFNQYVTLCLRKQRAPVVNLHFRRGFESLGTSSRPWSQQCICFTFMSFVPLKLCDRSALLCLTPFREAVINYWYGSNFPSLIRKPDCAICVAAGGGVWRENEVTGLVTSRQSGFGRQCNLSRPFSILFLLFILKNGHNAGCRSCA